MLRFRVTTTLILSALWLSATGCVSMNSCGPCGMAGINACDGGATGDCNPCRLKSGSGCGELYVDEWLNERPTVDNCDGGDCPTYGRQPVRSLLRLLVGDGCSQTEADCDSGCTGSGLDLRSPILQDGFEDSAHRGTSCACSHCSRSADHVEPSHVIDQHLTAPESVSQPSSPGNTPEAKQAPQVPEPVPATEGAGLRQPTPAPPVPKSANRLNPASRRLVR
jgi:hypothetical protein